MRCERLGSSAGATPPRKLVAPSGSCRSSGGDQAIEAFGAEPSREGAPGGSIEPRVSPSLSKIPYGGFSPVRLQMDRQWRPSTTSRGLTPSTPPHDSVLYATAFAAPRNPRSPKGLPVRTFRFNVARPPATPTRPSRGPWLASGLCCPDGASLTLASSEPLNPSPPLMDSRRSLLHISRRVTPEVGALACREVEAGALAGASREPRRSRCIRIAAQA